MTTPRYSVAQSASSAASSVAGSSSLSGGSGGAFSSWFFFFFLFVLFRCGWVVVDRCVNVCRHADLGGVTGASGAVLGLPFVFVVGFVSERKRELLVVFELVMFVLFTGAGIRRLRRCDRCWAGERSRCVDSHGGPFFAVEIGVSVHVHGVLAPGRQRRGRVLVR
jgi:hypothetical protein